MGRCELGGAPKDKRGQGRHRGPRGQMGQDLDLLRGLLGASLGTDGWTAWEGAKKFQEKADP